MQSGDLRSADLPTAGQNLISCVAGVGSVPLGEQFETAMPTVLRSGPYRFYFYSNERNEPPHVHVRRDSSFAKYWLRPIALASSRRFSSRELRGIHDIIEEHCDAFLEAWDEHISR